MKKILAVLLAVVMIVSCMSVAFAEQVDAVKITATAAGGSKRFQFETAIATEAGDEVEIILNVKGLGLDVSSYCIRDAAAGKFDHDGAGAETTTGTAYSADGEWVVITATAKTAGSALGLTINFAEDHANGAYFEIVSLKVGGQVVNPADYVDTVVVFSASAKPASLTAEVVKVDAPVVGGTESTEDATETEDTTVEETGVVSIAVVAVAAVIGGAVVLKKREF